MAFEWQCPFCQRNQMVGEDTLHREDMFLDVGKTVHGNLALTIAAVRCVNPSCNELYLAAELSPVVRNKTTYGHVRVKDSELVDAWKLRPTSFAKPYPGYVPAVLTEDYQEACKIRDLSPKASATLSRRCLQGMIRDFCGISKSTLFAEIDELRTREATGGAPKGVTIETIEAIDAVRTIGNIGAHMEKDISVIVDVDPGEAQALIELLELLFEEWYIARHSREQKLQRIQAIAAEKAQLKLAGPPQT